MIWGGEEREISTLASVNDCATYKTATAILGGSIPSGKTNEYITRAQAVALGADPTKLTKYISDKELVALSDIVKKNNDPDYLMFEFQPIGSIFDGALMPLNDPIILNKGEVELVCIDYLTGYFDMICSKDIEWVHTNPIGGDVVANGNVLQCNWSPRTKFNFNVNAMINGSVYCSVNIRVLEI